MKRAIFLNQFFFPDHSATSQILTDLAFHLAASGSRRISSPANSSMTTQITTADRRDSARCPYPSRSTTQFGRSALLGRSIDYISYYFSTWRRLCSLAKRGDIVVAMTDPPLISIIAMLAVRAREAQLVNWLQDIYPEVAIQLMSVSKQSRWSKSSPSSVIDH